MACGATLKRHREFDPLQSSPDLSPKRICLPIDLMSPSPSQSRLLSGSAFVEAAQKLIHDKLAARMSPSREKQMVNGSGCQLRSNNSTSSVDVNPAWPAVQPPVVAQPWNHNGGKANASPLRPARKEQLFTMRQVEMICRNVVQEHEGNIREEFNNILANKLAEQYEGLLSFNQAQIHNRFDSSDASYVS